jgi:hypothetical protein
MQGDEEFPVEIAIAEKIPYFKCEECGMLHIGEPGGFDPSEVEVDLEELMNKAETLTPKSRIEPLYRFMKAAQARGIIAKKPS